MEKRVCAKFCKLTNVVGRVNYISNPKRQENLLGFYQTPEDPNFFWRALSEETQELASYNKAQIEEHNRIENEKFERGEIKKRNLWCTVEARENILALPNSLLEVTDPQDIAEFLANDIKERHGIECAVGVHLNKTKTNLHAHIIMPERTLLQDLRVSIATRNTYYDENGKRSNKKDCVDENGNLKPGCRLVKKGENLNQRRFSEKDPRFASKGFCYGEKKHYSEFFNEWDKENTWVVYNHYQNPHMRLYNLRRGEPEALRNWKEKENAKIRVFNTLIDKMLESKEITVDQAVELKKAIYAENKANNRQEKELRMLIVIERNQEFIRKKREDREAERIAFEAAARWRGIKHEEFILDQIVESGKALTVALVELTLVLLGRDNDYLSDEEKALYLKEKDRVKREPMVIDTRSVSQRTMAALDAICANTRNNEEPDNEEPDEFEDEPDEVETNNNQTMQQNNRLEDLIRAAQPSAPRTEGGGRTAPNLRNDDFDER